ncbi:hypothetical protein PV768_02175 [Pseudarthrobacter sp. CC4]|uniref:MGH1-like glycoside hydrolase domain-containing protein n=1 Tax=Pseudarthrobacter sp. CC4 TaxID=3029190 RepID=UPI003B8DB377
MGALVTHDADKTEAALAELEDPARFGGPFGPANVVHTHPSYDPGTYWRGPAWPLPLSRTSPAAERQGRSARRYQLPSVQNR